MRELIIQFTSTLQTTKINIAAPSKKRYMQPARGSSVNDLTSQTKLILSLFSEKIERPSSSVSPFLCQTKVRKKGCQESAKGWVTHMSIFTIFALLYRYACVARFLFQMNNTKRSTVMETLKRLWTFSDKAQ